MKENIPSKLEILTNYFELMQQSRPLLFRSDRLKNQGDLPAAISAYSELINVLEEQLTLVLSNNEHFPDTPMDLPMIADPLINALLTKADVVEAAGDLHQAEEFRERAMLLASEYLPESSIRERERQRAASLISLGRFNEALVFLTAARDRFEQAGDALHFASATANIAGIREWLGDVERALQEVERASTLIEPMVGDEPPSSDDVVSALVSGQLQQAEERAKLAQIWLELAQIRARVNRYLGNNSVAEQQFKDLMPQIPYEVRPAIDCQLVAILIADGNYQEALEHIGRLKPLFKGLLRPKLAVLLKYEAESLTGLARLNEALPLLTTAIDDLSCYHDPDSLWKLQWLKARVLRGLDQPNEALTTYSDAISTINALRKAPLGYRLDSTYLRDKLPVFTEAIEFASAQLEPNLCCRFIELIKSRSLTATLSVPDDKLVVDSTELDQKVGNLTRQLDAMEYAGYRNGWTDEIEQRRSTVLSQRTELIERIRFSDSRWRSLTQPVPFELETVLSKLAQHGQAALTLYHDHGKVTSVLLKGRQCLVANTALGASTVEALAQYQKNLQAQAQRAELYDPSIELNLEVDKIVSAELLGPALDAAQLIVVPHGSLHLLPWAGLMFEGKRLFQFCPVGILPNLSCLIHLQTQWPALPEIRLIGAPDYSSYRMMSPLRLAAEELGTIEEIYSQHGGLVQAPMVGDSATEEAFWRLARHKPSTGSILHVACHATYVTGDPMNSGLLFNDGKADANEIIRTRLEYDEVILSACSTGYRPTHVEGLALTGDDILGLPGSLLEAGARSVLVSIPRARDDVTLQFMTMYHENRAGGSSPLDALQGTQLEMLESPIYPAHLWIGFTVYGCS